MPSLSMMNRLRVESRGRVSGWVVLKSNTRTEAHVQVQATRCSLRRVAQPVRADISPAQRNALGGQHAVCLADLALQVSHQRVLEVTHATRLAVCRGRSGGVGGHAEPGRQAVPKPMQKKRACKSSDSNST